LRLPSPPFLLPIVIHWHWDHSQNNRQSTQGFEKITALKNYTKPGFLFFLEIFNKVDF
jgi:hypothetical protein